MRILMSILVVMLSLSGRETLAARTDMVCEFGQPMSIGGDHRLDNVIEVIWRGRAYTMERVRTSTGAHRFEDQQSGLIWISIPAKAMLLDARRGAPVVNDCKVASAPGLRR
jgi:hypothetical protein